MHDSLGSGSVLVISDGQVGSSVCCAMAQDSPSSAAERLVLWVASDSRDLDGEARAAVRLQADFFGPDALVWDQPPSEQAEQPGPLARIRMLVEAAAAAVEHGCRAVIWPVVSVDGLDGMARAAETAGMLSAALLAELGPDAPTIETPLVDLDPERVLDLADDLGLPPELCRAWDSVRVAG